MIREHSSAPVPNDDLGVLHIADQGHFFVGGDYFTSHDGILLFVGQMYVQFQLPADQTGPWPIVLVHGGNQTGTNFTRTPDGRRGWMDYFVSKGYATYVVDQVGRGRSGYFPEAYGPTRRPDAARVQRRFLSPGDEKAWPTAYLHSQGVEGGKIDDPDFNQMMASQVEDLADNKLQEDINTTALIALLEKIGPSVLLTHSQSGPLGWRVGDARPDLVRALVAVEPNGPPIGTVEFKGAPDYFDYGVERAGVTNETRGWGLTRSPLEYDPPAATASEITTVRQSIPDAPGLALCYLQSEPPRQLPRLAGVPIMILTGEASYHNGYDHCTSRWLSQAGVDNTHLRLEDIGIHGNSHMMMIEKNNMAVAEVIHLWIKEKRGE